jgi:sec-independent protein translocase protein TatA
MFGGISFTGLLLILLIVLVIFGGNKLPGLGEGFGKMIRNFKRAASEPAEIDVSQHVKNTPVAKDQDKEQHPKQ